MNHGIAYTPPLYSPVAICPGKNVAVLGWKEFRFAIQPDRANVAGQVTSVVIRSGVLEPEMNRCWSCWSATFEVGDSERICTVMFGCSFSNAFMAAVVAVPSPPRPCVANTMVCFALAATWLDALELVLLPLLPLLLQPAAASASTAPAATVANTGRRRDG